MHLAGNLKLETAASLVAVGCPSECLSLAMAYPSSPEVGLEGSSGLDHLINNTEFENIQHTKAIESERERIKAYKSQLEETKQQTVELESSTVALDEQTMKLHKQFAFNQENFESLKHTSTVLGDHEDALRRKVSTLQTNVEQEYSEQSNALSKYEAIWATYQAKYESKEKVKVLRSKEEELHTVQEHNAQLEKQIQELEQTIHDVKQNHGKNASLVSWVLQIATLRCGTNHHLKSMSAEMAMVGTLRLEIGGLKVKVLEAQSLLEKREMEAEQAIQQQTEAEQQEQADDVAAMETEPTCARAVSNNFQPPHFENPSTATSAGLVQTPMSFQPPTIDNTSTTANYLTQQQHHVSNNTDTQRGQQKKVSRFLLEMPQLSTPRSRPITVSTPATPRAQVSSISIAKPNTQQQSALSQANKKQRRVTQLQMPSLHIPSPSRPTTSTANSAPVSIPTPNHSTTLPVTSKSSLQIRMPAQIELSRPTIHQARNKTTTETQSGSDVQLHMPRPQQQQHVGPINSSSPEKAGNHVQDGATGSNATAPNTSQETQKIEKNNALPSETPQDVHKVSSVNKEAENLNTDQVSRADRGEGTSVFNTPDVQIQQPLPLTTPTQQTSNVVNIHSTSVGNTMEMTDPPIITYSDPTLTGFNPTPQEMDTTNSTSQEPTDNVYSMYGGEMYQQPNEQMQMDNALAGQYFDGGVSAFGQADGFGGGIFGGQSTTSSFCDGGFNFGGSPATPQQQQGSGGFGFSFGGDTTPTSNSTFSLF